MWTNCQFFHQIIRAKMQYVGLHTRRLPSHLQYVATLPCESKKKSKSNQIFTLDLTINMLNLKLLISYVTYHKKIVH